MKVYHSIEEFSKNKTNTILTIGTFDGVHLGHQKIIERLNSIKSNQNEESTILTFYPHPRIVLDKENKIKILSTIDEKIQLLNKFGLDNLIIQPFSETFSAIPFSDFVEDILIKKINTKKIIIGYDHKFGKNREGDFEQLKKYSNEFHFDLEKIPALDVDNMVVSSTKIRNAINDGNILIANNYLGYNYLLSGEVIRGRGLGRKLNFPTVNIHVEDTHKLIPKTGVYIVKSLINNHTIFGIMNIGYRPTVNGKNQTIEAHLLDFNQDLYGNHIQIEVLNRLRDEQKFDSVELLTEQVKKDEVKARVWIAKNH